MNRFIISIIEYWNSFYLGNDVGSYYDNLKNIFASPHPRTRPLVGQLFLKRQIQQ